MGECQDNYNSIFYNNYSFVSNMYCLSFDQMSMMEDPYGLKSQLRCPAQCPQFLLNLIKIIGLEYTEHTFLKVLTQNLCVILQTCISQVDYPWYFFSPYSLSANF